MKQNKTPITGKTKNAGWQIGVRRTMPINLEHAWELITSSAGIRIWLGNLPDFNLQKGVLYDLADGTSGEVRVFKPFSHLRLTWHPTDWQRPSTIQVRVIGSDEKSTISFHQEHLPGPKERSERRVFFKAILNELENLLTQGDKFLDKQ
jgi:uncharacterized protein YndB with AHSA1/START domain